MKTLFCFILLIPFACPLWGQDSTVTDFEVTTDIATTATVFGVYIEISLDASNFGPGVTIDADRMVTLKDQETFPEISIRHLETDERLLDVPVTDFYPIRYGFWLKVSTGRNKEMMEVLKSKAASHFYISISRDLPLALSDGSVLYITPQALKRRSATKVVLTRAQVEELVKKLGGEIFLYGNRLDFGKKVNVEDTTAATYTMSFSLNRRALFPWNSLILFGHLSTDEKDPLRKLGVYPVNVNLLRALLGIDGVHQVVAQLGIEGDQDFDKGRVNINLMGQGIIPNIVDFTAGEKRLRLKPVLALGVKGLFEFENDVRETENRAGLFSEIYYFVPVLKHYSLLLEGNLFWLTEDDLSLVPENAGWNCQVTLGYELPGIGLKTIAKYSFGEDDVNLVRDERLIIGFVVDLFERFAVSD